jgi:hypothetical protein
MCYMGVLSLLHCITDSRISFSRNWVHNLVDFVMVGAVPDALNVLRESAEIHSGGHVGINGANRPLLHTTCGKWYFAVLIEKGCWKNYKLKIYF